MFSFFSSLMGKAPVKKIGLSVLALVLLAMALGSCKQEADEPTLLDKLKGEWVAEDNWTDKGYTKYTINMDTLSYDDGNEEGSGFPGYEMSFTAKIKYTSKLTGEADGIIIVQYTDPPKGEFTKPNYNDGFIGIYFKGDVDKNELKFSCAIDTATYAAADVETLDSAKNLFTGADYNENYIGFYLGDPNDSMWNHITEYLKIK